MKKKLDKVEDQMKPIQTKLEAYKGLPASLELATAELSEKQQALDKLKGRLQNELQKIELWFKVEKILKGSLDLIPSPSTSVKIQIMGGKVCLRYKGKTLLGIVNKLFFTSPSDVLPYYLKKTF